MQENQKVEWKESWRDEYLKWICGFANAQGGKLYIGVRDNGQVVGVPDAKRLMEDLPNKIRDILGLIADVNLMCSDGKEYLEIVIGPSPYPVNYHGEFHYRSGSTKQELKGNALSQFLLKKTGMTWENVTVGSEPRIEHFRNDGFDIFREEASRSKRVPVKDLKLDNLELARKLDLLENDEVTRAAILLFHHEPERWITGAWIKIGYFTSDAKIAFQDEVHGSLFQQANSIMDLIYTKYLVGPISYEGITRVENYPYPREALREAILNAIVHKNYGNYTPIQIRVYPDRIRIANQSVLPDGVAADRLLEDGVSRPMNPKIANAFYRAGFIESWGRGIQEIRETCRAQGMSLPIFEVLPDMVMATFSAAKENEKTFESARNVAQKEEDVAPKGGEVAQKEENVAQKSGKVAQKILCFLSSNPQATTHGISRELEIAERTVKYNLAQLKKRGLIRRAGGRKIGHWDVVD